MSLKDELFTRLDGNLSFPVKDTYVEPTKQSGYTQATVFSSTERYDLINHVAGYRMSDEASIVVVVLSNTDFYNKIKAAVSEILQKVFTDPTFINSFEHIPSIDVQYQYKAEDSTTRAEANINITAECVTDFTQIYKDEFEGADIDVDMLEPDGRIEISATMDVEHN